MKDLFSANSDKYKNFRPSYPDELPAFICSLTEKRERAWDCGTGSGQLAIKLARHFSQVEATDISENQLANAPTAENICYSVQAAEKSSFNASYFDLITVGQAIHWFDFQAFYIEVNRTLKPGGIIAVIGYNLCMTDDFTDQLLQHLYKDILGPYWDAERRFIDEKYQTIPFPFEEIRCPEFEMSHAWNLQQFMGYLSTWSALKHYIAAHKINPLDELEKQLRSHWKDETKNVRFEILLRVGKKRMEN